MAKNIKYLFLYCSIFITIILLVIAVFIIFNNKKYEYHKEIILYNHPKYNQIIETIDNSTKNTEEYCTYVTTFGIQRLCDINICNKDDYIKYSNVEQLSIMNEYSKVYICVPTLIENYKYILDNIKKPIILISSNDRPTVDINFFNSDQNAFIKFIESDKIKKWYCLNCVYDHPKIFRMPIGMDYHSNQDLNPPLKQVEHDNIVKDIVKNSVPFFERKPTCYTTFHFQMGRSPDRQDAFDKIPKDLVFYEESRLDRIKTYKKQCEYAFVVSPLGNGMDCHRTWEALILGCIPIVKTSGLDKLYDDLPVLIVKDWGDVTSKLLTDTINNFKSKKFNYDKLTLAYWINDMDK